jgi:hypothetical protein
VGWNWFSDGTSGTFARLEPRVNRGVGEELDYFPPLSASKSIVTPQILQLIHLQDLPRILSFLQSSQNLSKSPFWESFFYLFLHKEVAQRDDDAFKNGVIEKLISPWGANVSGRKSVFPRS